MYKPVFLPGQPIAWILDFDGTLTKRDTLDTLVNISAAANPERPIREAWHKATQAYLVDYSATLQKLAPDGNLPTTVLAERNLLQSLRVVEQKSIERVSTLRVFTGVTSKQLHAGAHNALSNGQVQIRDGLHNFLHHIIERYERQDLDIDSVRILSVNWSRFFIDACLRVAHGEYNKPDDLKHFGLPKSNQLGQQQSSSTLDSKAPLQMDIIANELEGIVDGGRATGRICAIAGHEMLMSSHDKMAYLQHHRNSRMYKMKSVPIVYVGDSWTDFECLLAAELGICIRDDAMSSSQKTLKDSLNRLSIRCPHISEWEGVDEWGVVWARDFVEIEHWAKTLESLETTS